MTELVSDQAAADDAPPQTHARRVTVVYNPTAGRWKRRAFARAMALTEAGGARVELRETAFAGDAVGIARDAAQHADIVVAAGGDGTINEVLNGLLEAADRADAGAGAPAALGVIPLGTANVFAHEIGIGADMARAAEAIHRGPVRPVWLGTTAAPDAPADAARVFAIMAGVGFDAQVVADVTPALKHRLGKAAYVYHSLRRIARFRPESFTLTIDGMPYGAASAILANGHFYAGRYVSAPEAGLDRDSLEVCLFTRTGRWNALRYGAALLFDRLARLPDVRIVAGREILIEGPPGDPVQGDGEIVARLPVRVAMLPRQVGVAMPPDQA